MIFLIYKFYYICYPFGPIARRGLIFVLILKATRRGGFFEFWVLPFHVCQQGFGRPAHISQSLGAGHGADPTRLQTSIGLKFESMIEQNKPVEGDTILARNRHGAVLVNFDRHFNYPPGVKDLYA